jgi:hypothetical protein
MIEVTRAHARDRRTEVVRRSRRGGVGAAAVIVCLSAALALSGCGGAAERQTVTRRNTISAAPQIRAARAHTFIAPPANAIVSMRRFSPTSLMWQTIFVRPNGSGLLTTLIGEEAGAPHRPFQLSARQLASLRRLVEAARSAKPGPSRPGPFLYTVHLPGEATFSLEGPMPKPLHALVAFLDGLTLTYCC